MKPKKLTDDEIQSNIRAAVMAAVDFCESEVAEDRIKAAKYFNGYVSVKQDDESRSKVIATKCRDTVRMVKPVLMRTFLQSGSPVQFVPVGQDDIQAADQATKYVEWKFNENNGYSVLHDVFHDALVKKTGVAKVWWDDTEEVEFDEYNNISPDAFMSVIQGEGVEVLEAEQNEDGSIKAKVSKTHTTGRLKVCSIAPEDFFVDSGATSIDDCLVCGDTTEMRVGDLAEMGFDFDEVYELSGFEDGTIDQEEDQERRGYHDDNYNASINDPSMRPVQVTEAYMRMDIEGTGIPKLYQFILAGSNYKMLDYTPANDVPYSVFEIDPEPHAFFGRSLVDLVIDDQDAATSLLRGLIDNVHMTNNPGLGVDTNMADPEDAQNKEIGRILRADGDPSRAYVPFVIPSQTAQLLPALQFYNESIEDKTGVSKASLGMDANALQSTTAAGVNAAVQAGSAQAELMARNLAEGGMRRLFKLMMRATRQNAPANEMMRLNGQFVPVDPQSWNASMDLMTNVGLGTGQKEQKLSALMQTMQDQGAIWQAYGPSNPLVTLTHMYNVRAEILELSGIHDVTSYYNPMTPEIELQYWKQAQQLQQAQQGQQGTDPNAAFLQAEMAKVQVNREKAQADYMRGLIKDKAEDDRKRDEMAQNRALKAAEIAGKHGIQLNEQAIKAEQAAPRSYGQ